VAAATEAAKHHHGKHGHHLVVMCAADWDYRELARNWHKATQRVGLGNALVYALDLPALHYLTAHGVPAVDGSDNLNAWNRTRIGRHIQRAEAERHVAAAAVAASGLDVLLTEATHVLIGDITPTLHALVKNEQFSADEVIDLAVPKGNCNGRPPVGCGPWWNLVFLRGAGTIEQRRKAVTFQMAGVRKGMIDFYLRWFNGAHCIMNGFGKEFMSCSPKLEHGATAESLATSTTTAVVSLRCHENVRIGLLPDSFFNQRMLYANGENRTSPFGLIGRSAKPEQRDRLNLNRYDAQDFVEMVAAMRADGLWFL